MKPKPWNFFNGLRRNQRAWGRSWGHWRKNWDVKKKKLCLRRGYLFSGLHPFSV